MLLGEVGWAQNGEGGERNVQLTRGNGAELDAYSQAKSVAVFGYC